MALYLLHGNVGSAADWESLPFSGPVEAIDLWAWQERFPGLSLADFGRLFAEDIAARGDRDPVLAGYSLGGRLALHALMARPDLWRGVVLISTHPGLDSASDREIRLAGDRAWARRARQGEWGDFLAGWNAQPLLAGQPVPASQSSLEPRREAVARAFESWSLGHQIPPDLSLLGDRVLWVAGTHDAGCVDRVRTRPGRLALVLGAGHRLPWERPGELVRLIERAVF